MDTLKHEKLRRDCGLPILPIFKDEEEIREYCRGVESAFEDIRWTKKNHPDVKVIAWQREQEIISCWCAGADDFVPEDQRLPYEIIPEELAERIKQISSNKPLKENREKVLPYSWENIKKEVDIVLNA